MAIGRLDRFVSYAGWLGCLASICLVWLAPGISRFSVVQWSPWLAGLLVLGIPHGALDHRVGAELQGKSPFGSGVGFYLAYISASALVLCCWFLSPMIASIGFLAVAAAHFGQGDLYWSTVSGLAGKTNSVGYRASLLVLRSVLPIVLPLVAFPEEFSRESAAMATRLFGRPGWVLPSSVIHWGLLGLFSLMGLHLGFTAWVGVRGDKTVRRAALVDLFESVLLAVTFWTVPPVLALGIYFNCWHSLRHISRLSKVSASTRELLDDGRLFDVFAAFWWQALPMTCGALLMMACLGIALGRGMASVTDVGLLTLVMLSALTLPHVLVVTWMDFQQGVWSDPKPREVVHVGV